MRRLGWNVEVLLIKMRYNTFTVQGISNSRMHTYVYTCTHNAIVHVQADVALRLIINLMNHETQYSNLCVVCILHGIATQSM